MMNFQYRITGLKCASCVEKIKTALSSVSNKIEISQNPPLLTIDLDESVTLEELNALLTQAGHYQLFPLDKKPTPASESQLKNYYPIFLIGVYITGVTTINNLGAEHFNWHHWMTQFMAGFFLVFSAFKFFDLKGFAEGYATYDLLAKRYPNYGFIYPFLELGLGILYLTQVFPVLTNIVTILIMGFSSLGVIQALLKKQNIRCACLGTVLNVPISTVTLIEDLLMVGMAFLSLRS